MKKVIKKKKTAKRPQKPAYLREVQIRFKKKRVKNGSPVGKSVTHFQQVYELFKDLEKESKEKLIAIALDSKLRIICFEVVAIGSLGTIFFRPAEALRITIAMNGYGIILLHNHPSGDPTPSPPDKKVTKKLSRTCEDLGIIFLDHVIIGEDKYFSFVDAGLLKVEDPIGEIKKLVKKSKKKF